MATPDVCFHGKLPSVCETCARPAAELLDEWRDIVVEGHQLPLVLFTLDQNQTIWFHTDGDRSMVRALVADVYRMLESGEQSKGDTDGS